MSFWVRVFGARGWGFSSRGSSLGLGLGFWG